MLIRVQHLISLEKNANITESSKLPLGPMSRTGTSSKEGCGKLGQFRELPQGWLSLASQTSEKKKKSGVTWPEEPKSKRQFNM